MRFFLLLFLFVNKLVFAVSFVSVNLCTDRLLVELAKPNQIKALSTLSDDPFLNLKPTSNYTKVKPDIESLLPFKDSTILLDTTYDLRFYEQLKTFGFNVYPINAATDTKSLIANIKTISELTEYPAKADTLFDIINTKFKPLNKTILTLEDGLSVRQSIINNKLFSILGLSNISNTLKLSKQNQIDLENLIPLKIDLILIANGGTGFSKASSYLTHPALQKKLETTISVTLPVKYQLCFDHGIWLGAKYIKEQLP